MRGTLLKYLEVARITLRSRFAYIWDQLLSTVQLALFMFVFVQLWKVTFAAEGGALISGYSFEEMIWYLVMTESIILSLPRIHATIEAEVKGGDLALRLNKPYNYLLFHYAAYLGEGLMRLVTLVLVGGTAVYWMIGGIDLQWRALPVFLVVYLVTQALHFCYSALMGLAAFWVEDVSGLYFIWDRVKWVMGGMLLPIEVFPDTVRRVAEALPFRYMIGGPARLFVKYEAAAALGLLQSQILWVAVFGGLCWVVYRLGVRRVDLHGG